MRTSTKSFRISRTAKYKYGFCHRHRAGNDPARSQRRRRAPHLGEEERARVAARVAAEGYRTWLTMKEPTWAQHPLRPDRLSGHHLLRRAEAKAGAEEPGRGRSRDPRTSRSSASRSRSRSCSRGVAVDAVFDSVSVATTFKEKLAELGIIFCSFSEAVQDHPDLVQQVPRHGGPVHRQLLRDAQFGGLQRRLVRLHPEGRALPDGAVDLFPHQRAQHRPVRAHADRRRGGRVTSATSKAARRRCATRTSCTRRSSSSSRSTTRTIKYSTVQNWYPGDKDGKGGIYNFVTKRGNCRGRELEDLLDAGRDRLGDHLEVPELHPAGR